MRAVLVTAGLVAMACGSTGPKGLFGEQSRIDAGSGGQAGFAGSGGASVTGASGSAGTGAVGTGGAGTGGVASMGCANDFDCKGSRVCQQGQCVDPGIASGGAGGAAAGGDSGSGGGGSSGAAQGGATTGDAGKDGSAGGKCVGEVHANQAGPVDMYIMFDQSGSMSDPVDPSASQPVTWWQTAQNAVTTFVNDPRASGMGVGLQYFPLDGVAPASCSAPYSTPEVPIATLPGPSNSQANALATSIANHQPTAFTPTRPALQGAVDYMTTWAPGHAGRAPVVVLVTDGFPTECGLNDPSNPSIQEVVDVAKAAYTNKKIRTFVIGFDHGAGLDNLNQIAIAGGTSQVFLITSGNIGSQFVSAMLSIASTPTQCELSIPAPSNPVQTLSYGEILVDYIPNATKVPEEIPKVNSQSGCALAPGQRGWYYDDNNNPKHIEVCAGTCQDLGAGVVETVIGCKPTIVI